MNTRWKRIIKLLHQSKEHYNFYLNNSKMYLQTNMNKTIKCQSLKQLTKSDFTFKK